MGDAMNSFRHWVGYALVTVALWGVWGALAGLSAQHGFPDTLGYCVWSLTMIPPALFGLARNGWKLDRSPAAMILLAQAYGYAGHKEKVLPLLENAASVGTYVCPYESAAAYLSIGDTEHAMTLLDEAVVKRSNCLIFLRGDPRLNPIRQHPHFQVLLNRVGFDDVAVASYKR